MRAADAKSQPPVIVLDGFWRKTVAIVRGLASAGEVPWCGEVTRLSPGLRTRHCRRAFIYPSPIAEPTRFRDAILNVARSSGADVMFVGETTTLNELDPIRSELASRLRVVAPSPSLTALLGNKVTLASHATERGVPIPRTVAGGTADLPADFPFPARWKPAQAEGSVGQLRFPDLTAWNRRPALRGEGVVQEELLHPTAKVGLGLLLDAGEIVASFAYRKERELYPHGGASTQRVSVDDAPYLPAARRLVAGLRYEGLLHLEFFELAGGEPILIEANPRPWGSLALAIEAGMNFPALVVARARGRPIRPARYRRNVRACWLLPGDLLARWRNGWGSPREWSGATFDLWRDDDPGPAIARVASLLPWWIHPHFRALRERRASLVKAFDS